MRQLSTIFPENDYPQVTVGLATPDDAAVYQLDDTRSLIQTTDFFTPIVDDPYTYGAIAATNAMSDVYAMGGEVLVCLNIAGFPETLDVEIIGQILAGGADKVKEAGAVIAGGHTVTNPEPFYGLSVTGTASSDQVMCKGEIHPGDRLFLTKPLGTGVITTAAKLTGPGEGRGQMLARRAQGKPDIDPAHLDAAIASMTLLNRAGSGAARQAKVQAATDITGFGLLGHGCEMAVSSAQKRGVKLQIRANDVPVLPGVYEYIQAGYLTRGHVRNPDHFGKYVEVTATVSDAQRIVLWEAETSGGLLLAVQPGKVDAFHAACDGQGQLCWEIGKAVACELKSDGFRIEVV